MNDYKVFDSIFIFWLAVLWKSFQYSTSYTEAIRGRNSRTKESIKLLFRKVRQLCVYIVNQNHLMCYWTSVANSFISVHYTFKWKQISIWHDDVIKWKHFCVTGHLCGEFTGRRWIPHKKGQRRGSLMFSVICVWINGWKNNREAGDLRRYRAHYDFNLMVMEPGGHEALLN